MGKLEEFLLELETELQYLKPKDASEVLKYYRDRINIALDYGETIEHILSSYLTSSLYLITFLSCLNPTNLIV